MKAQLFTKTGIALAVLVLITSAVIAAEVYTYVCQNPLCGYTQTFATKQYGLKCPKDGAVMTMRY